MKRLARMLLVVTVAAWATAVWILADGGTKIPPSLRTKGDELSAAAMGGRRVELRAADGVRLAGWGFRPGRDANGATVVVLHGIGSSRSDMLGYARMFLKDGYAVVTPDLRAHGESGGEMVTYGVKEKDDLKQWIEWTRREWQATKVIGFGESLGGSVALEALGSLEGAIAECAYAEFPQVAAERVALQLPVLPVGLIRWMLVSPAVQLVRVRSGVDLNEASAIEAVRRNRKPVLLIHGLRDDLTPLEHSRRLRAAAPERVTLWEVPGAVHVGAHGREPAEFERRVLAWSAAVSRGRSPSTQ